VAVIDSPTAVPRQRYILFAGIAALGVTIDLWSKWAVFHALGFPGKSEEWNLGELVRFQLRTSFNEGALWGLGQGGWGIFAALSVAAVIGIVYFLFIAKHARSLWLTVALAFVTAGALGNLYDRAGLHGGVNGRFVHGVRDFLDFQFFQTFDWAIFNVADSMLVTGAIMLVIHSLWGAQVAEPGAAVSPQTNPAA